MEGPTVRPYTDAVRPGFFLMHDYAGSSWRLKEQVPVTGPHGHLT